jgi:hypothetical protein
MKTPTNAVLGASATARKHRGGQAGATSSGEPEPIGGNGACARREVDLAKDPRLLRNGTWSHSWLAL